MNDTNENHDEYHGFELAIIGVSGRFPGADDLDAFWRNLVDEIDSIEELSEEEMLREGADPAMIATPTYVRKVRRLSEFDRFDNGFFGISPREAEIIDPQQRIFLELSWAALEDAGYDPARFPGMIGVFGGTRLNGYFRNVYSNPRVVASVGDLEIQVANDKDYVATRVSYKLDLGGPSVTVQTACSTAIVALHAAGQALQNGECAMALAGGVGLRVPETGHQFVPGDVLTPDGKVRAFDAKAEGTMFSSGGGVLVLRRLEDAIAAGDHIRAVVKGSAITNDGAGKVGFTAPGFDGQVRVLRAASIAAEVPPETVTYIEAHGTGTQLGDPIEVSALTEHFRRATDEKHFCALGSVKTNIGHLGAAAGVASLAKAVLCLERKQIPASLNFETPNPEIDFENSPFFVNTELRPWESKGAPLRVGVSSFGMGGTNAHAILEEAPATPPPAASRERQLLLLSARTETAADRRAKDLADHLETKVDDAGLPDVAYTLQVGRRGFEHRRFAVVEGVEDAVAALRGDQPGRLLGAYTRASDRPVTFMFSGQGAQYPGMARGLYEREPTFKDIVDRCCAHLDGKVSDGEAPVDLKALLTLDGIDEETAAERLRQTAVTQPALFVVEYALARLLIEWGVKPESMIGHSIGEYVAACLAGVFSLEDALDLVAYRGQLMQKLPSGAMLSVPLGEDDLRDRLSDDVAIATINAPERVVVAGSHEAIAALEKALEADGIRGRRLETSHAFHSPMMEPILAPFAERVASTPRSAPEIPVVSNVTGRFIRASEATDPSYWAQHLRQAVRFADGLATLAEDPDRCLIEIGPGRTLVTLARQQPDRPADQTLVQSLRHPKDDQDDLAFLLGAFGQLWLGGADLDPEGLFEGQERRRVSLPTYPFERQKFWVQQGDLSAAWSSDARRSAVKNDVGDYFSVPFWKPSATPSATPDPDTPRTWLLFADTCGLATTIGRKLSEQGQRVVTVEAGEAFEQHDTELADGGSFTVRPSAREDYTALLSALAGADAMPDHIAHLFAVGPTSDTVSETTDRGFWSLLFLAQAIGALSLSGGQGGGEAKAMSLVAITDNLHVVGAERDVAPEKGSILGPAKVMGLEYPNLEVAAIDVVLPDSNGATWEPIAEDLIAELLSPSKDPVIAYRDGRRLVQTYDDVHLDAAGEKVRIREQGVYMITGGLGGIGLSFAEALARDHHAKLSLVGLSPLPDREGWDDYLAKRGADRIGARILKVRALEALGADVLVTSADVGQAEQIAAAVRETLDRFGRIDGVIHAAGLAGGGMIQLKAPEAAQRVLAPKIEGTINLSRGLETHDVAIENLDFLVLCSSTIAVAGGFGQVDYCAANSFLDAYAHAERHRGRPVVAVNWGAWEEVGMAVDSGLMPSADDGVARPPVHPLIDRAMSETAERSIYETDFSPERHFVLSEHRIMGTPAVPGTTYLEMARAAYSHHSAAFTSHSGLGAVELRDVYFLGPMMVPEGQQRTARLMLEPADQGLSFRVTSEDPSGKPQAHARGKVRPIELDAPVRHDLEALRARMTGEHMVIEDDVLTHEDAVVRWGARWQSLETVSLGDGEALAEIAMPADFADEVDDFVMHPALIDVATSLVGFMEDGAHLPLSYHRVVVGGAIPGRLFSHVEKLPSTGEGKETVSVNVSLMDEDGVEQVRIERFTLKTVGDAQASLEASARQSSGTPASGTPASDGAESDSSRSQSDEAAAPVPAGDDRPKAPVASNSGGITPANGVEALYRMLGQRVRFPQIVCSAKDIQALFAEVRAIDRDSIGGGAGGGSSDAIHSRPNLPTPYREPETELEKTLAEVWQKTLGIDQVGIDDNFFDLGGDSIIGIQMITRLGDQGLELSPEQLFEHQTVAALAAQIDSDGADVPTPATVADAADAAEPTEAFAEAGLEDDALADVIARFEDA